MTKTFFSSVIQEKKRIAATNDVRINTHDSLFLNDKKI